MILAMLLLAVPQPWQVGQAGASNSRPSWTTLGGFVSNKDGSVTCEWPGSTVFAKVRADSLVAHFSSTTNDERWQLEVDGKPQQVLKLKTGENSFTIPIDKKNFHRVLLVKRTEAFAGRTTFQGFTGQKIEYSDVAKSESGRFRLLVIGDSISAGFGVDGKTKEEPFSHDTSNAYMTYGWIAARKFGGFARIIAWSGKKMWPDNTIPEIFDFTFPSTKTSPLPQSPYSAIVINLATNDFSKGIPDKQGWMDGYRKFLARLRKDHPKTPIFLATGSMMSDSWPPKEKHLSTVKSWLDQIKLESGDSELERVDFATQLESDGIGSSWHPNAVTQAKMAETLAKALRSKLDKNLLLGFERDRKQFYGD